MTEPMTAEQVGKLRMPPGYSLKLTHSWECDPWQIDANGTPPTRQGNAMVSLAIAVANGFIHPAIITAAWSIIDGTAEWCAHNGDEMANLGTEDEARAVCEKALKEASATASQNNEWPDWVDQIEYGIWIPVAKTQEFDGHKDDDGDDACDYRLEKVGGK